MPLPQTFYESIEEAGARLYVKALTDIPRDVRVGLKRGHDTEVTAGNRTDRSGAVFTIRLPVLAEAERPAETME